MGESGSPSISRIFSSFTWTSWPQPTAQYGQIERTTRSADAVLGPSDSVRADRAVRPSAVGSPEAICSRTGQRPKRGSFLKRPMAILCALAFQDRVHAGAGEPARREMGCL